jgi:hypothetical protein
LKRSVVDFRNKLARQVTITKLRSMPSLTSTRSSKSRPMRAKEISQRLTDLDPSLISIIRINKKP